MNSTGFVRAAKAALLLCCVLMLAGCFGKYQRVPEVDVSKKYGVATRQELLADLRGRMDRLLTLKAKAIVELVDQGLVKNNKFARTEVNGQLLLRRDPDGDRRVRFTAQMFMPAATFSLTSHNDDFWVLMPDMERGKNQDGKRGTVYVGKAPREALRPSKTFSYRPQDLADVFLMDEVYANDMISFMETWKQYYIIHFLRQDWKEHVYSKIWISRRHGNPAIHQIFDSAGELIVEGRFTSYQNYKSRAGKIALAIPREMAIIWPRDKLVMNVLFENVKLNDTLRPESLDPVLPSSYRILKLRDGKLVKEEGATP